MKKFSYLASLLLLVCACSSDENNNVEPANKTMELSGQIVVNEDARTSLAADGLATLWSADDKIGVFANGTQYEFTLKSGDGSGVGKFASTTIPATATPQYAYYPYSASNSSTTISGNIPASQLEDGFADYDHKVSNAFSNNTFQFRQTMAMVKLQTSINTSDILGEVLVQEASLIDKNAATRNLSGDYTIDITSGSNIAQAAGNNSNEVKVVMTTMQYANGCSANLFLLPNSVQEEDKLDLIVKGQQGSIGAVYIKVKAEAKKTYKAGTRYTISAGSELVNNSKLWFAFDNYFINTGIPSALSGTGLLLGTESDYGKTWYKLDISTSAKRAQIRTLLHI